MKKVDDGGSEGEKVDEEVGVVRDVGQSESSAPTMLEGSGRSKGKERARKKRNGVRSSGSMSGSVYEGQCSGAPPFVVPPMQFSIGM